jgi:adenylate kinase
LGTKAKEFISKGELVPDSITIGMLKKSIEEIENPVGFIFDGFPRTINQSEALDELLSDMESSVNKLIRLEVSDQEIIDRIKIRAETSGRPDDADETIIINRISVYQNETQPVYKYYQDKKKSISVDGTGTLEEISARLSDQIDKIFQKV